MYALIYKDKVISGPRKWSKPFWSVLLEELGIKQFLIPRNPVENLPLIIDEDTKICKAEVVQEQIDNRIQYYQGPTWNISGDVAIASYEIIDTPLEFARGNFREIAKNERRKKENTTIKVTIQDVEVSVSTHRDERTIFSTKLNIMGDEDTVNWKFPEVWLTLSKSDLLVVVNAIDAHVQSTFDWEKNINDQINAVTTNKELLGIEIIENRKINDN